MNFKRYILISQFFISLNLASNSLSLNFNTLSNSYVKKQDNDVSKSMMLSMIVPGLGQYYKGDKKKALIFMGIELTALFAKRYFDNKGDERVYEYQEFSDQHWSFENWIRDYDCWNIAYQGINNDCNYEYSDIFSNVSFDQNGNQTEDYLRLWEHSHHLDFYFEDSLISTNDQAFQDLYFEFINWDPDEYDGNSFVEHYNIVVKKDHHFYEGIRKYNMFFAGWDDAKTDIQKVIQPSGYVIANSPNKSYYNKKWNQSIDMYDYAEFAITTIYLNHVISVLDIYFKSKFDNRIKLELNHELLPKYKNVNYMLNLKINLK